MGSGKARSVMVGTAAAGKPGIAERFQPLHQCGIEAGLFRQFRAGAVLLNHFGQAGPHVLRHGLLVGKQIAGFARIFGQVVQLGLGRVDEVIIVGLDPAQFAPVEVQAGQKGLSVQGAVFARLFCPHQGKQVLTLHLSGNIYFQFLQHGRHQVGKIHQAGHHAGRLLRPADE